MILIDVEFVANVSLWRVNQGNNMKNVTYWSKALEWLNHLGLGIEGTDDTTTFFSRGPSNKKNHYTITIPIDTYLDKYLTNRDAFENIAFFAEKTIVYKTTSKEPRSE